MAARTTADESAESSLRIVFLASCSSDDAARTWTLNPSMTSTLAVGFRGPASTAVASHLWSRFLVLTAPLCKAHTLTPEAVAYGWGTVLRKAGKAGTLLLGSITEALKLADCLKIYGILSDMEATPWPVVLAPGLNATVWKAVPGSGIIQPGYEAGADAELSLAALEKFAAAVSNHTVCRPLAGELERAKDIALEMCFPPFKSMTAEDQREVRSKWEKLVPMEADIYKHSRQLIADPVLYYRGTEITCEHDVPVAGHTAADILDFFVGYDFGPAATPAD